MLRVLEGAMPPLLNPLSFKFLRLIRKKRPGDADTVSHSRDRREKTEREEEEEEKGS